MARSGQPLWVVAILVAFLVSGAGTFTATVHGTSLGLPPPDEFISSAVILGTGTPQGNTRVPTQYETFLSDTLLAQFGSLYYYTTVFCNQNTSLTATDVGSLLVVIAPVSDACPLEQLINSTNPVIATTTTAALRLKMATSARSLGQLEVNLNVTGFLAAALRLPDSTLVQPLQPPAQYTETGLRVPNNNMIVGAWSSVTPNVVAVGGYTIGDAMADGYVAAGLRTFIALEGAGCYSQAFQPAFTNMISTAIAWGTYSLIRTAQSTTFLSNQYTSYNAAPVAMSMVRSRPGTGTTGYQYATLSYRILDSGGNDVSYIARPLTNTVFTDFPTNLRFGVSAPGMCGDINVVTRCNGNTSLVPTSTPFLACRDMQSVKFTVGDVPQAPVLQTGPTVLSGSVTIHFDRPPVSCMVLTGYTVFYAAVPGGGLQSTQLDPMTPEPTSRDFSLPLTPGQTYNIYVVARNALGSSPASQTIQVTLPQGCPTITATGYAPVSSCGFPAPTDTTCDISCPPRFFGATLSKTCQGDATWGPDASPPICTACDPSCATCSGSAPNECLTCPPRSFFTNGYCPGCASSCTVCTSLASVDCVVCDPGYVMQAGTGCVACATECATCNNTRFECTSCPEGDILVQHNCTGCQAPCQTCSQFVDNCESCVNGYYQDYSACLACPDECNSCAGSNNCTACKQDLLLVNGACVGCDSSCALCSGPSATECLSCGPNLFLVDGACGSCPAGGCQPAALTTAPIPYGLTVPIIGGAAGALALCSLLIAVLLITRARRRRRQGDAKPKEKRKRLQSESLHTGDTTVKLEDSANPVFADGEDATSIISDLQSGAHGSGVALASGAALHSGSSLSSGGGHHHTTLVLSAGGSARSKSERVAFTIDQGALKEVAWTDLTILSQLGGGSIATVYHVRENNSYTDMAVKVYNKLATAEQVAALARRSKAWSAVHHTHCVPCYGLTHDPTSGCVGLLTKHMPRGALSGLMETMSVNDKLSVLRDACKGLAYVHGSQLVHGALSPRKILLDAYGVAAIGDLANVGTPNTDFAAPEVLAGEEATAASDLFAFGLTALHVLTGDAPAVLRAARLPPRVKGVSKETMRALMRCVDAAPAKRGVVGGLADAIIGGADD